MVIFLAQYIYRINVNSHENTLVMRLSTLVIGRKKKRTKDFCSFAGCLHVAFT